MNDRNEKQSNGQTNNTIDEQSNGRTTQKIGYQSYKQSDKQIVRTLSAASISVPFSISNAKESLQFFIAAKCKSVFSSWTTGAQSQTYMRKKKKEKVSHCMVGRHHTNTRRRPTHNRTTLYLELTSAPFSMSLAAASSCPAARASRRAVFPAYTE